MSITPTGLPRRVLDSHANGQGASVKFRAQALPHALILSAWRLTVAGPLFGTNVPGRQRRAEHQGPRRDMAG